MTNFHCGPYRFKILNVDIDIAPYELYVFEGQAEEGFNIGQFDSIKEAHVAAFKYILEEAEDLLHHARCCLDNLQRRE
jgi:hypothetical protein